jgi:hypothetical protein
MRDELINLFGRQPGCVLDPAFLPPMLNRYLELTSASTDAKPGVLLTAFLPFCAVNLGNRVYMQSNSIRVYPNIWSCVIGPSSISRKSTALRYAGYTLRPFEQGLMESPLDIYEKQTLTLTGVTLSKLMSYLCSNPARLFVHNELAAWLHEMQKSYNAGYKQVVTELYDNVDRTISNRDRVERIIRPALSIAAASTEGWLYKNMMDGADLLSGFLQRMIFFVVRNISVDDIDLSTREGTSLDKDLEAFDTLYFQRWRSIPGSWRLPVDEDAIRLRDTCYEDEYKACFAKNNDVLMSYFTRIFDGYWFKFCILFQMSLIPPEHYDRAAKNNAWGAFFAAHPVTADTAAMAWDLCRFYLKNTLPLLEIMDEQDKLAGERKLVEIIINKYGGKAKHSDLMNMSHMRKKEFRDSIESLIEREAITVETFQSANFRASKQYDLAAEIMESWRNQRD